ncbi:MAG: peptidase M15A [Gemmatimonadetes bacterium]|nr:peptidase M15A [Gemmatimonadota bacterium]
MKLSEHFTLEELCKSQTAIRMGIDNSPSTSQVDSLRYLAQRILEPVRSEYGVPYTPSSGYRSPDLNRAIGGSSTSQHCLGQAADIEIPNLSNLALAWWIRTHLDFDQLILEHFDNSDPSSGWVHVSVVSPESRKYNRHDTLVYDGKSYSRGLPG